MASAVPETIFRVTPERIVRSGWPGMAAGNERVTLCMARTSGINGLRDPICVGIADFCG